MHFFVFLFIQALLAQQQNTQVYAIMIKFSLLWYSASFQLSKNHDFIHLYFVIMKVYLSKRLEYFLFNNLTWFIIYKYLDIWYVDLCL